MTARHVASSARPPSSPSDQIALALANAHPLVFLTGGATFLGLAGYSYISGMSQLDKQRAAIIKSNSWLGMRGRKMGIGGLSLGLAYMGLYRLFG